jgi:hypothetical protein
MRSGNKIEPRLKPHYVGVEPKVKPYIDLYKRMAKEHGIKFTKKITVGFTDIQEGKVVGICFYGKNFREIDVDTKMWAHYSSTTREDLLFHELTHCLCNRGHDYGDGEAYPTVDMEDLMDWFQKYFPKPFYEAKPGHYVDGCPLSIMYTHVVADSCMRDHSKEYFKEMFNRCNPYR